MALLNVKVLLYVLFTCIAAVGVSGINFDGIIKKGKTFEARVLVMCITFSLGYLLANFVIDFLNL